MTPDYYDSNKIAGIQNKIKANSTKKAAYDFKRQTKRDYKTMFGVTEFYKNI